MGTIKNLCLTISKYQVHDIKHEDTLTIDNTYKYINKVARGGSTDNQWTHLNVYFCMFTFLNIIINTSAKTTILDNIYPLQITDNDKLEDLIVAVQKLVGDITSIEKGFTKTNAGDGIPILGILNALIPQPPTTEPYEKFLQNLMVDKLYILRLSLFKIICIYYKKDDDVNKANVKKCVFKFTHSNLATSILRMQGTKYDVINFNFIKYGLHPVRLVFNNNTNQYVYGDNITDTQIDYNAITITNIAEIANISGSS